MRRIANKIVNTVTSSSVKNSIGAEITKDVNQTMLSSQMPNGKGGIKKAPKLTKKTQKTYRGQGVSTEARFQFKNKLMKSIKPTVTGNTVKIQSNTNDGKKKLKWLKNSKKITGKLKKSRIVMGWTKNRTKIIKKILSDAIKQSFR